MRRALPLVLLLVVIAVLASAEKPEIKRPNEIPPPTAEETVQKSYQIGVGDILQIAVWKEPDLSVPSVQVRPDGRVSVPVLGDVRAAGLMPKEFQESLRVELSKFVPAADVFVLVREVRSERAFVIGGVRKEGAIVLSSPITVLQILAEAGGLTEYAKPSKIHVLRIQAGKQVILPFDYSAVIRGHNVHQNIVVLPGDTVVVPK